MSKDGSEDGEQVQKEVPGTANSPLPGYGSHTIGKILEKVPPSNIMEYWALLEATGFDTLESPALPISEFREEVAGMKARHARALLNLVAEERGRLSKSRKLGFFTLRY